jgi:hypothetical protein
MLLSALLKELKTREAHFRAREGRSTSRDGRLRLQGATMALESLRLDLARRRSPERVEGLRG